MLLIYIFLIYNDFFLIVSGRDLCCGLFAEKEVLSQSDQDQDWSSRGGTAEMDPTSSHEGVGSLPGLDQ